MDRVNRKVILTSRPVGVPQAQNFTIIRNSIRALEEGEILVRNQFLSIEPAMRGWISDRANYADTVAIGAVMRSICVGTVIESLSSEFSVGEIVVGWFGWQEYATVPASAIIRKVSANGIPVSTALGILGINGITALLALRKIGAPSPGDTVVVSTAAGAVGSAAGQIAKFMGCRTVGIAGGPHKVGACKNLYGYDTAVDYKAPDIEAQLGLACPDGINVYFDNTGGAVSDAVYPLLAERARVIVCGTAATSDWTNRPVGPRFERHVLVKRLRIEGFVVFDHAADYGRALCQLEGWVREGTIKYHEDILEGIESCPDAIAGLYRGENFGKRIVRLFQAI